MEWVRFIWISINRKISKFWISMKDFRKKIIFIVGIVVSIMWKKGMDIYYWLSWDWVFVYSSLLYDLIDVV